MKNILSKRQTDSAFSYSYLRAIWHVDADGSYHTVKRKGIPESDYIAVRTIRGCGKLTDFSNNAYLLAENTIGIFRSSDVAQYRTEGDVWEFYWFRFDHMDWNDSINWVSYLNLLPSEQNNLERCFTYLNHNIQEEIKLAESLFHYLLCDWMVHLHTDSQEFLFRQRIFSLLENGYRKKTSIVQLCKEAGMSERNFRNTVHRICGMSPKDYMIKLEMETAMDLLQTTNQSIAEISFALKYENPFYFSRAFKKYYGMSPKQARESLTLEL